MFADAINVQISQMNSEEKTLNSECISENSVNQSTSDKSLDHDKPVPMSSTTSDSPPNKSEVISGQESSTEKKIVRPTRRKLTEEELNKYARFVVPRASFFRPSKLINR